MEIDTEKITTLYNAGRSTPAIARETGVAIHTVYRILRRAKVRMRSQTEQNKLRFLQTPKTYSIVSKLTPPQRHLQIAALMLYWGEGAKTGNTVDLANSSMPAIKLFLKFLREICQIDENKLRFYLYCFSEDSPTGLINYWAKALKVSKNQFTKPYVRQNQGTRLNRTMPQGVIHIRYSDKKLLEEILTECKALLTDLTA